MHLTDADRRPALTWVVNEDDPQTFLAEDPRLRVEVLSDIHEIPGGEGWL